MGSHSGNQDVMPQVEDTPISGPTVEIKIKTSDSQAYTLRVDKYVPVPTLKEQIATVTGILSERQRLISRGRVLKDDQLLSAYYVEDGHTLHLVVREPVPLSESANKPTDAQGAPGAGGPTVVVGTFYISSDQRQGSFPDLDLILSAVNGSLGVPRNRNASTSDNAVDPPTFVVHRTSSSDIESARMQPVQASGGCQPNPTAHTSQDPPAVTPTEYLQPSVIPDSLTTLSQYLDQVTDAFELANCGEQNSPFDDDFDAPDVSRVAVRRGLPTPEDLAEVLHSTRQLLINQAAENLTRLDTRLQNQADVTDASARVSIQSNAMRSGILLRNLGALLLELGRTTMCLRIGQTPADAVVDAGSAVFVNESGPNLITVQHPIGSMQSGSGFGTAILPRSVDIRIRTGGTNQTEESGTQRSSEPVSQATTGTPEVHIFRPIRAVSGAVPIRASQSPDPAQSSAGMFVPVTVNGNETGGSAFNGQSQPVNRQSASASDYFDISSIDESVRNMFNIATEQPQPQPASANDQPATTPTSANGPQSATATSDDGVFFSNLLQQIMPYISENVGSGSGGPRNVGDGSGGGNDSQGSSNARFSSYREADGPPSLDSKRQGE